MSDLENEQASNRVPESGEPYRTPTEVNDQPLAVGFLRRRTTWLLLVGLLVVGGAGYAIFAPRQINYIKNYGDIRRKGPPRELPVLEDYRAAMQAEYEAEMSASQLATPQQAAPQP